jgi:hypothetical protein
MNVSLNRTSEDIVCQKPPSILMVCLDFFLSLGTADGRCGNQHAAAGRRRRKRRNCCCPERTTQNVVSDGKKSTSLTFESSEYTS